MQTTNNLRFFAALMLGAMTALLAGCGGSGATTGTGTGTSTTTSTGTPTLTVTLSPNALSTAISSTVTATLTDATGAGWAGQVVTFSTDTTVGTLSQTTALTNASGVATVTLSQATGAAPGAAYVTANSQGQAASAGYSVGGGTTSTGVTVGSIAIAATPATATADGYSLITVKATVLDAASQPISGQPVQFQATKGTPATASAVTNSSGVAQFLLTAPTTTGTASVVAISAGMPASTLITFNPGLPASIALNATPAQVSALGTSTIVATLTDINGNAVGAGQTVTFGTSSSTGGHFTDLTGTAATSTTTDALGIARMNYVAGTCAGTCTDFLTTNATNAAMTSTYATNLLTLPVGGAVGTPTLTISPIVSPLTAGTPITVTASVKDATGTGVANSVVTFKVTDSTLATLTPSNGTALTDSSGNATITLTPISATAGATTITAASVVGTSAVSASYGFSVGQAAVTLSSFVFGVGAGPLSAYGTTSMSVDVKVNGVLTTTPMTVDFTSTCSATGKAVLSTSVTTVGGVATGSYRDNGCAGTDVVTATVSGIATLSTNLAVNPPTIGSVQFVSASPTNIALKGIGGTETSQVTFKVVDASGNPLSGQAVTFALSTTVGGITLTPAGSPPSATSDSNGLVVITVNSGVVSTPVRVIATSGSLTTQSSQLTITTGIPDEDSFSLAASAHNIEGWTQDGTTSVLSARLADHFNNPVPDGTAVNFTTEGGSVVGSCTTIGGTCTATFTSQSPRSTNGRETVLAYAVGEESFTDLNGNGVADTGEMIDANGNSTDLPEAYVDFNENGTRDAGEPFFDFNQDNAYNAADGKYNGVLCTTSGICSTTKSIHVRRSQIIVLSSSSADISLYSNSNQYSANAVGSIDLSSCNSTIAPVDATQPVATYYLRVVDVNGNAMPVGTRIDLTKTNGTILSTASIVVADSSACNSSLTAAAGSAWYAGCPASAGSNNLGVYLLQIQSDATSTGGCTNATHTGLLTVTVTSPKGLITTQTYNVND